MGDVALGFADGIRNSPLGNWAEYTRNLRMEEQAKRQFEADQEHRTAMRTMEGTRVGFEKRRLDIEETNSAASRAKIEADTAAVRENEAREKALFADKQTLSGLNIKQVTQMLAQNGEKHSVEQRQALAHLDHYTQFAGPQAQEALAAAKSGRALTEEQTKVLQQQFEIAASEEAYNRKIRKTPEAVAEERRFQTEAQSLANDTQRQMLAAAGAGRVEEGKALTSKYMQQIAMAADPSLLELPDMGPRADALYASIMASDEDDKGVSWANPGAKRAAADAAKATYLERMSKKRSAVGRIEQAIASGQLTAEHYLKTPYNVALAALQKELNWEMPAPPASATPTKVKAGVKPAGTEAPKSSGMSSLLRVGSFRMPSLIESDIPEGGL